MDDRQTQTAENCLRAAENDSMTFPQIIGALMEAGFESYAIDYRAAHATFYRPDGNSVQLPTHRHTIAVAESFDTAAIQGAIREAQQRVPGYTYKGFCEKVMAAGCAGYIVSFSGRRAVYFGRTAEVHIEHFPQ